MHFWIEYKYCFYLKKKVLHKWQKKIQSRSSQNALHDFGIENAFARPTGHYPRIDAWRYCSSASREIRCIREQKAPDRAS